MDELRYDMLEPGLPLFVRFGYSSMIIVFTEASWILT